MRHSSVALALALLASAAAGCGDGTPSRVYVPVLLPNRSLLSYQPTRMIVAGDGSEILTRIRYRSYDGPQAEATGTLLVDDCVGSCAAGTFHPVKATVRFQDLVTCHRKKVYTTLNIDAPGAPRFNHVRRQHIHLDDLAALCEPTQR